MAELKITDKNFNKEVLESDKVVLIDFWAPWCAPCRMMGPVIEQLAAEYDGKAKVGKVNVDEETGLAYGGKTGNQHLNLILAKIFIQKTDWRVICNMMYERLNS